MELSKFLQMHDINADYYHAGLNTEERNNKQEAWIKNKTRTIVCTNAFGMGIDKPDVRLVVHYDIPDCLENYYQEAGRAGRDGEKAYAVLLYQENDLSTLTNMSDVRFPPIELIGKVYESIAHYLQIPSGSGADIWNDFDLTDFCNRFKIPVSTAVPAIQLLEQEGWLTYAGKIFLPSKIVFTCDRNELEYYEERNPKLETLIKTLLRTYGGIFTNESVISEFQIARILQDDKENIIPSLYKLHADGIIRYSPSNDKPQIQLLENRPVTTKYLIHPSGWLQRKTQFEKRLGTMYNYIQNHAYCRSNFITNYFGDISKEDCGICDNCLKRKKGEPDYKDAGIIEKMLFDHQHIPLKELMKSMDNTEKELIKTVISFLLAEEKATMNEDGQLIFKK